MASIVSLVGVSKQYKRGRESVAVLNSFDLEIPEKDFVAIMGPFSSIT
jgi:putative ABC transport system ATP-binding protein